MAKDFTNPYENHFWANTQKHGVNCYEERWRLFGAIIGDDEELCIVRHTTDGLPPNMRTEATVASQTGLHILIKDTRDVVGFIITDEGGGSGDLIQTKDSNGTVGAKLTSGGAWTDASSRELKTKMKRLADKDIESMIGKIDVYRYEYLKEPGTKYISPEAEEFNKATKLGDKRTIAPKSIASIALRAAQLLFDKFKDLDKRLAKLELTEDGGADKV